MFMFNKKINLPQHCNLLFVSGIAAAATLYFSTCWLGAYINNTARWEMGGGRRFFSQIEPNFPLPYCSVVDGCYRLAGRVTCCSICASTVQYNTESPKRGSKRFNSQVRQNTWPIWVHNLSIVGGGGERISSSVADPELF